MDDPQPELLALLRFVHGDIFDMANAAQPTYELAFDKDRADGYDHVLVLVDDDEGVVRPWEGAHGFELPYPGGFTGIGDFGEDFEYGEVPAVVIRRGEGT